MDEALLRSINGLAANPIVAQLGIVLSSRWMLVVVLLPLAFVWLRRRQWPILLSVLLAVGCTDLLSARLIKPTVDRVRPCRTLDDLVQPLPCGRGESFPSNHAALAFACLFAAAPAWPLGWWLLTPLAIAVSLSRVLLGVHYPSDILAGALFGATMGGLFYWGRLRLGSRKIFGNTETSSASTSARKPS